MCTFFIFCFISLLVNYSNSGLEVRSLTVGKLVCCQFKPCSSFFYRKKTKRAKALRESTSINQADKEKYAELMAVVYRSSEESLSEPESEGHRGEISGSDEDIPNKKRPYVRPLPWRSDEVNILMTRLDRKIAR